MVIFIKCESSNGDLKRMVLIDESRASFDELYTDENKCVFQSKLEKYLDKYHEIHVIGNTPDDINFLIDSIILDCGSKLCIPTMLCEINRELVIPDCKVDEMAIKMRLLYLKQQLKKRMNLR